MGLPAQTAKHLARILIDATGSPEKAESVLTKWDDVRGLNGNFRMTLDDILTFVKKIGSKNENQKQFNTE